jgi:Protein of unknown function (DUF1254)/Citrate synthase, C-terminal domain
MSLRTIQEVITANQVTPYIAAVSDLQSGPVVLEVPAKTDKAVLYGQVVDAWQATIADLGPTGADKGAGGKYLFLPPGYADHEQNCSTSTVRMVASSEANLFASVASGVCAVWGPLYGAPTGRCSKCSNKFAATATTARVSSKRPRTKKRRQEWVCAQMKDERKKLHLILIQ